MRQREVDVPEHVHQPEFTSISYTTNAILDPECFAQFVAGLSPTVHRAKGFVRMTDGSYLFNFVAGRWELEPFDAEQTTLVLIGQDVAQQQTALLSQLEACEQ
jgi:G3E family GTPase